MAADGQQAAWWQAFPAPRLTTEVMPRQRASMILNMRIASLLIIDVRRVDYEGGSIRGSLNIPAQGFWWNRGMLYELAYKAGIEWVVFTCGSSQGRAPRCASWFLEHVREVAGDDDMQVMTLDGGIKGWVKSGPQYTRLMDGYDEAFWTKLSSEQSVDEQQIPRQAQSQSNLNAGQPMSEEQASTKRPLSTIADEQQTKRVHNP